MIFIALGSVVGFFVVMVVIVAIFWNKNGKKRNQEDNDFIASMPNAPFISRGDRPDVQRRTLGTSSAGGGQMSTGSTSNVGNWLFINDGFVHLKVRRRTSIMGMNTGDLWAIANNAAEVSIPVSNIKVAGVYSGEIVVRQFVSRNHGIDEEQLRQNVENKICVIDTNGNIYIFDAWDGPKDRNNRSRDDIRNAFLRALSSINPQIEILR